jgi:hypothetical protein
MSLVAKKGASSLRYEGLFIGLPFLFPSDERTVDAGIDFVLR